MGKKRRGKQSAAEIPTGAATTPNTDSPSPPHSPATTFDADVSPSMATRSRRRVPQVPASTKPQPRKQGRPKSSAASEPTPDNGIRDLVYVPPIDVSPLKQSEQQPSRKRTRGAKFSEPDSAQTSRRVKRKWRSEEGTSTETAIPTASKHSKRRKAEKVAYREIEAHFSDADESQGEAADTEAPPAASELFSDDEVKAREGPSGASSSAIPATDSTPQWASQLLDALKALGECITSLDEAVRRLHPPSDP